MRIANSKLPRLLNDRVAFLNDRRHVTTHILEPLIALLKATVDCTEYGLPLDVPPLEPWAADLAISRCAIVEQGLRSYPYVLSGKAGGGHHYWCPPINSAEKREAIKPSEKDFVVVSNDGREGQYGKLRGGLFTSTGLGDFYGMWYSIYLPHEGQKRPAAPYIPVVNLGVQVLEVDSAVDWVRAVELFPSARGRLLMLDWAAVAKRYDVHITIENSSCDARPVVSRK